MLAAIAPSNAASNSQYAVESNIQAVSVKFLLPSEPPSIKLLAIKIVVLKNIDFKSDVKNTVARKTNNIEAAQIKLNEADKLAETPEEVVNDLKALIADNLTLIAKGNNPRLSQPEWQRLFKQSNDEIKSLLAVEGYFSPTVTQTLEKNQRIKPHSNGWFLPFNPIAKPL